jgi:outer membrane assembly lipoprotein YfiO
MKLGRCRVFLILSVAFAVVAAQSRAAEPGPPTQPSQQFQSNPILDRAEALLQAHHWKAAHDLIVPWLLAHPAAPDNDRGLFLLAEVYYQNGDRIRAFYHLDELMDKHPESKLFFPALDLQYDIADAYLKGYDSVSFFGLQLSGKEEEAIDMLFRIQERSPGSPIAERALLRTANYYFATSQFDVATDAYSSFIRSYPRSPAIPRARLRQAFSSLAMYRGPHFDSTPLLDARAEFRQIQSLYPDLAAEVNASQWIDKIDADLARKAYLTGDFYRRTHEPRAAVYMYRYVIQTYPNSTEAAQARRDLARMPQWALSQPPPPESSAEAAAATQPTGASHDPGAAGGQRQ